MDSPRSPSSTGRWPSSTGRARWQEVRFPVRPLASSLEGAPILVRPANLNIDDDGDRRRLIFKPAF
eukprot:1693109-Prymnesium_polylepis.2